MPKTVWASTDEVPKVAIRLAASAVADIEAIGDWYVDQGAPEVVDQLIREIMVRIEGLADHPEMGRIVPEFAQRHLRELIQPLFRIVHRTEPNLVRIVRVWRGERLLVLPEEGNEGLGFQCP